MKKYYIIGGLTAFIVVFNLGYVFHEIIAGRFFKETIIPLIALAFVLHQRPLLK